MKRTLLFFFALLMGISGVWATDVTVSPSTGVYWKNNAPSSDAWAPQWKSTMTASDGTTPLLVLTGQTGMNTATGDIYSNQTYTLEAPAGYTIVSYSFNGTASGGDVTITPAGGSGTLISDGSSLGSPLSVPVVAQTTTFALSGAGHITNMALTVTVEHCIIYSTSTGSYTTTNNFVHEWNSTATDPQVTFAVSGGANNIEKSTGYIYSGANGCTYVLTAQAGYVITGYEIVGTAQTAAQTLTPAAGGSATMFATSGTTTLTVTGLSTQSTTFTQSTPNKGIAISSFKIFLEKDPCTVKYVISDANGVIYTSDPFAATVDETITTLPSALQRDYCTYSVTSTTIAAGENTVTVTVTYNLPFTLSSSFASATWYYATLRGKQLRADDSAKDSSGRYATNSTNEHTDAYKWAFFGDPYNGFFVMNKNQGSGKYLYKETQLVFKSGITPTSDNNALFAVTSNSNGGFTLRNIGGGANWYINDAGNNGNLGFWNSTAGANDAGSKWIVTEVSVGDKAALGEAITTAQALVDGADVPGYINSAAAATLGSAISTAQGVYDDPSGDYGSAYITLAAAIATASAPANINYTPRTDVYYTIVNSRGAMVYDPSHSSSVDAQNDNAEYIWYGSTTPNASDPNNLWGFIESDGHYYMYNVGKRQFASVGHGGYGNTWIFSNTPAYITLDDGIADEIVPPGVRVRATIATTGSSYTMSVSTNYTGPVITYDANGDGGVPMVFAESSYAMDADVTAAIEALIEDVTPYRNALKDVIDGCASIPFGAGLNQYSSNSTYTDALTAANTAYNNASATKSELQTAKYNLESAIAGLSLNLPSAGFYRIKGYSGNYITSNTTNTNAKMDGTASADNIVYYSEDGNLIFYGSGYGLYNTHTVAPVGSTLNTYTFMQGAQLGKYYVKSNASGIGTYCYDNTANGSKVDRNTAPVTSGSYQTDWTLEEVSELPIALNAFGGSYYSTFYSPVNVEVSGAKAYTLTLKSNYLSATEISDDVIPANTGVVLVGNSDTATATLTNNTPTVSKDDSVLTGTVATATSSQSDYIFTVVDNEIGFYKNGFGTVKGFKAFYRPSDSSVRGFAINFGLNDAITDILHQVSPKNVYDLQGRRVNEPAKGLYIINGKKVIK